jgi:phosphomannomutase
MRKRRADIGGEGSSGGLIDGSFNFCRDSMLAALLMTKALKEEGQRFYASVPSYYQERLAFSVSRRKSLGALKELAQRTKDADTMDGVKIRLSKRSWVLIRPSNTEDLVRVSAEAETELAAKEIALEYADKLRELSK